MLAALARKKNREKTGTPIKSGAIAIDPVEKSSPIKFDPIFVEKTGRNKFGKPAKTQPNWTGVTAITGFEDNRNPSAGAGQGPV
jgi:hypothetical protein